MKLSLDSDEKHAHFHSGRAAVYLTHASMSSSLRCMTETIQKCDTLAEDHQLCIYAVILWKQIIQ
jgi:hypothetical protein